MTHGNANTFPFLAQPAGFLLPDELVPVAEGVVRLFRDHGDRSNRKRARLKYLVRDWGIDRFQKTLAGYLARPLPPPRPIGVRGFETHLGWHPQGPDRWYYGLHVPQGRIKDEDQCRLRSGVREVVHTVRPQVRLTPLQDILFCGLSASDRSTLEKILTGWKVPLSEERGRLETLSMACPALPTCGLALTEAERVQPALLEQLQAQLRRLALEGETIGVRMTGCPNGCVRTYQSEIGIVGRSGDKYTIFLGGRLLGDRLGFIARDLVPFSRIVPTLTPLLEHFVSHREPGETFGDFCVRLGPAGVGPLLGH